MFAILMLFSHPLSNNSIHKWNLKYNMKIVLDFKKSML